MIETIIVGLITSALWGLLVTIYQSGHLHVLLETRYCFLASSWKRDAGPLSADTTALQKRLVRYLLRGQSWFGQHRGEYGKSRNAVDSGKWQTKGSRETLDLKPRMYLTYWPAIILHKHGLVPISIARARAGVRGLFSEDRIPMFTSAPDSSPTSHEMKWNYRHTMAAAHMLADEDPTNLITRAVVDLMLDGNNGWQHTAGGWWQTSEKRGEPDLWASVYAAKLLGSVISGSITNVPQKALNLAKFSMLTTFKYLEAEWNVHTWGIPDKLLAEENLVSMYIDLASLLPRYSHRLQVKCLATMKGFLSPTTDDLSQLYLKSLKRQNVHSEQAYARMAYALHLANDDSYNWGSLFVRAMKGNLNRLYSSELAFLLDLSFSCEKHMNANK
ncbi:MAG: hypothetical protein NTY45_09665 [Elusimicrobia bacterium]|nr:hypothetical protein [Elusimicrobiota bacterium]